jgi:cytosine/adenosine deaminase-related metal-dependent hydrolase
MADRILLKGGHVVTVDPELGDIAGGDVLIEGDTIAQVGIDLRADAEVIDATGNIVIRPTW